MKTQKMRVMIASLFVVLAFTGCGGEPSVIQNPSAFLATPPVSSSQSILVSETQYTLDEGQEALPTGLTPSEQILVSLYETVNPSVVSIDVISQVETMTFRGYRTIPVEGQGSGFIYDKNGNIITNAHVVEGATSLTVTFWDGSRAQATLIGEDASVDLAVIRVNVDAAKLIPVILGDSTAIKVGQSVVALGTPFGLQNSMSTGIISGLKRTLDTGTSSMSGMIQTDAAINPGNSGGPLLNLQGQVVGVNTAIESKLGQSSGVGYAVPSEVVKEVAPQLIAQAGN